MRVKVTDRLVMKHREDAMSVHLAVEQLRQEPFDSVMIYKPQGVSDEKYSTLLPEAFVLGIQTEFQLELYKQFAGSILCIDSTHGTNAYRFKLITCIVADEFGQGKLAKLTELQVTQHTHDRNFTSFRTTCSMVNF